MQITSLKIIYAWLLTLVMGSFVGSSFLFWLGGEAIEGNFIEYPLYFLRGLVLGSFLLPTLMCLIIICETTRDKTYDSLMSRLNSAHIICVLLSLVVGIAFFMENAGDFIGILFAIGLLIAAIYSGFAALAWYIVFRKGRL